jgi:hypothetical protein
MLPKSLKILCKIPFVEDPNSFFPVVRAYTRVIYFKDVVGRVIVLAVFKEPVFRRSVMGGIICDKISKFEITPTILL